MSAECGKFRVWKIQSVENEKSLDVNNRSEKKLFTSSKIFLFSFFIPNYLVA